MAVKVSRVGRAVSVAVIIAIDGNTDVRREISSLKNGTSDAKLIWAEQLSECDLGCARGHEGRTLKGALRHLLKLPCSLPAQCPRLKTGPAGPQTSGLG